MSKLYIDPATGWALPVVGGKIEQGYGPENTDPAVKHLYRNGYHPGIDIAGVSEGTDVISPCDGVVSHADVFEGKGNCVIVDRPDGLQVLFGHLFRIDVEVGQTVAVGDVLGGVGTTGVSTGVHLHYEYRRDGQDIDPVPFLMAGPPTPPAPGGFAAVVRESLNLRSGPSRNDAIIQTLDAGTKVVISQDGWVPVWFEGRQGWMFAEFLDVAKGE
ncbi:MAG: peptidoglycan DD-metalloendopeptidase family protein [Dehalococcoidia bacterium]